LNALKTEGMIESSRTEIIVIAPVKLAQMAQLEPLLNN